MSQKNQKLWFIYRNNDSLSFSDYQIADYKTAIDLKIKPPKLLLYRSVLHLHYFYTKMKKIGLIGKRLRFTIFISGE